MSDISSLPNSISNESFALAYQTYEGNKLDKNSPILVIHGIFGSTVNWHIFCKSCSDLTGRMIIAVDCRNHGKGPCSGHMSYPLMAGDITETLKQLNVSEVILIGHSMGGKIAMELALSMPKIVEKLIVEDMDPFPTPAEAVIFVTSLLLNTDLSHIKSKKEADDLLGKSYSDDRFREYLLTNLFENMDEKFNWHTNLKGVKENVEEILRAIELNGRLPYEGETLFIGGEDSPVLSNVDMSEVRKLFPKAKLQMIQGVGHFIHDDKPKEFLEIVHNFVK